MTTTSADTTTDVPSLPWLNIVFGLLLLLGGFATYQFQQDRLAAEADAARIAHYRTLVSELKGMEKNGLSDTKLWANIQELSADLQSGKFRSEEIGQYNVKGHPFGGWIGTFKIMLEVREGNQTLAKLKSLSDNPRKSGDSPQQEIRNAQHWGRRINEINLKVQDVEDWAGHVNATREDVANLIARVKNPKLEEVFIKGYWYTDGSGQ